MQVVLQYEIKVMGSTDGSRLRGKGRVWGSRIWGKGRPTSLRSEHRALYSSLDFDQSFQGNPHCHSSHVVYERPQSLYSHLSTRHAKSRTRSSVSIRMSGPSYNNIGPSHHMRPSAESLSTNRSKGCMLSISDTDGEAAVHQKVANNEEQF